MSPIKPENLALYPPGWRAISKAIRERAGDRCETCGIPNKSYRNNTTGEISRSAGEVEAWGRDGDSVTRIVLTVAHLDHDPRNCAPENLRALCQRCHLRYDAKHHAQTARRTRRQRLEIQDMFPEEGEQTSKEATT